MCTTLSTRSLLGYDTAWPPEHLVEDLGASVHGLISLAKHAQSRPIVAVRDQPISFVVLTLMRACYSIAQESKG